MESFWLQKRTWLQVKNKNTFWYANIEIKRITNFGMIEIHSGCQFW